MDSILTIFTNLCTGVFGARQKKFDAAVAVAVEKIRAENAVQVKEAIEGTEHLKQCVARIEKLEADREEDRKRLNKLERVLERVARGYDALRRDVLRLVRRLRDGKEIDPELLDDLEKTPNIEDLLHGVLKLD
jgi:septal ring factor EnvC (AmiA/AmiB activator)